MDNVRERHGVAKEKGHVSLREDYGSILLTAADGIVMASNTITPEEARYLASKLRRLAKRIEEKSVG